MVLKKNKSLKEWIKNMLSDEDFNEVMNFIENKVCVYRYKVLENEGGDYQYTPRETSDDSKKNSILSRLCYSTNHESIDQFMSIPSLNKAF
jgi:hypothetical protein